MTIHLYQHSKEEAFSFSQRALQKTGFTIIFADEKKGIISSRKQMVRKAQFIFCDIQLTGSRYSLKLSLISNVFSGNTGTFIADAVTEELFLEAFHDLLRIQPPDNPMKLSYQDYALAAGF